MVTKIWTEGYATGLSKCAAKQCNHQWLMQWFSGHNSPVRRENISEHPWGAHSVSLFESHVSIFPCKSCLHFCKRLCWSGSQEQCDCLCCAQKGTKGNSSLFYKDLGANNLRQLHPHHEKPPWLVIKLLLSHTPHQCFSWCVLLGKVDATVEVRIDRRPKIRRHRPDTRNQVQTTVLPLELKTGKMFTKLGNLDI